MNPTMLKNLPLPLAGRCDGRRAVAIVLSFALGISSFAARANGESDDPSATKEADEEFFATKVQPLLAARCYECHSHGKKIKGGLTLDSRSGWEKGGESGPALVPGAPEKSRLITAVQYADKDLQMPPKQKLPDDEIAVLVEWVKRGAPDPRLLATRASNDWESVYRERLGWWSLQPVSQPPPPQVRDPSWPRNPVDSFILASLEAKGLKPATEADRRTLARRLSFALTGLPPQPKDVERFVTRRSPRAYEALVQSLLDSPHFGERWARHWMDVVHYADTHGYEWDTPAKNAWMYRDYLIRAFNADVPFQQLVLEQIAGDLIPPRMDKRTRQNESILGPMAMRLGERRHGDNADAEGVTQEAVGNIIDTVSKGFLATTVACAQCHDHKLDAVAQRDYYGLAGILTSTRWGARPVSTKDPNLPVIQELKELKGNIRGELLQLWHGAQNSVAEKINIRPSDDAKPADAKASDKDKDKPPPKPPFPESMHAMWRHLHDAMTNGLSFGEAWTKLAEEFQQEQGRRLAANRTNLHLLVDFSRKELPSGWELDGLGMKHGLAKDGEMVIADEGDAALALLLPAGRWSHVWSARLAGAVRSRHLDSRPPLTFSVGYAGGHRAALSLIVDNAFHSERMKFLKQPQPGWLTLTNGNWPTLAGGTDQSPRRAYLELVTKSLNNYFPPRTKYDGLKESDLTDERSWFGVTRIYQHAPGQPPADELMRFTSLFAAAAPASKEEFAKRLAALVMAAVERWRQEACNSEDVRLINEALSARWLPNEPLSNPALAQWVSRYRETEKRLQPERVIGTAEDWHEGRDERIAVRGSYTDLGEPVPRGNISFLGGPAPRAVPESCGRLEFAHNLASDQNPLTARVFVNRVWHHLYGAGLVRTVDDFGHLGEKPSHPELLDWLALRFMEDGWSAKKLVKLLVTSATWRQSSIASEAALAADPENRLWHHLPLRRLEAEAIRDAMLFVSGRLDDSLYGPPLDPYRSAEDDAKRLFSGPLDGNGRRSLYIKMTLMEPPKFLALFNQPIPKLTAGRRDATNVPDQALALLNDPFVIAMAKHWGERVLKDKSKTAEDRVQQMFAAAFARPPQPDETTRLVKLAQRSAELRGAEAGALLTCQSVWQDVAHAIFNLKEFIYVQ